MTNNGTSPMTNNNSPKKNNTTAKNNKKNNTNKKNTKTTVKKSPSAKTVARKENEKKAKAMLNNALNINSKPMEYKPIVKYMHKKYNSEKERVGDIDDHIELIRKQRAEKSAAKQKTVKNTPVKKEKKKRTTVSNKESTYKDDMKAAKALLNSRLSIKSTPPEHNPIAKIMRGQYNSEADRNAAINAHIEKVRKGREQAKETKSAVGRLKKNATRKNRS